MVSAAIRTIFAQPTAPLVRAQVGTVALRLGSQPESVNLDEAPVHGSY